MKLVQMFCHHIYECVIIFGILGRSKKSSQNVEQRTKPECSAVQSAKPPYMTFLLIGFNKS